MCIKFVKINNETGHYIKAAELPSIMNVTNNHDHFKSLDGTNIFKFTTIHPVLDRFRLFWELISQTKGTESTKLDPTFSRNPESEPITSEDKNNWRKPEANDPIKFTEHH